MKKILLLSTLLISTSSLATTWTNNNYNKGVTTHIGLAMLSRDYSNFVNDVDEDTASIVLGLSYTTPNNFIIGASFAPKILDANGIIINGTTSIDTDLESSLYTIYTGYQFDVGLRLMAGLGYSYSKIKLSLNGESASTSKKDFGPMLGIGYTAPFGLTVDLHATNAKFAAINVDTGNYNTKNTITTMLMVGYQF